METELGGKQQGLCPTHGCGRCGPSPEQAPPGTCWTEMLSRWTQQNCRLVLPAGSLYCSSLPRWPVLLSSVYSQLPSLTQVFVELGWFFLNTIFRWKIMCETGKLFISQGCFILQVRSKPFTHIADACNHYCILPKAQPLFFCVTLKLAYVILMCRVI